MSLRRLEERSYAKRVSLRERVRAHSQVISQRCSALLPEDRAILKSLIETNQAVLHLAKLVGQPERSFRRRVTALIDRVLSHEFAFVARHRSRWAAPRRRFATAVFLEGRSIRDAAADLGLSYHAGRRQHHIILGLIETARTEEQAAPEAPPPAPLPLPRPARTRLEVAA